MVQILVPLYLISAISRTSGDRSLKHSFPTWYILKMLVCAESGVILIALSTINPSLALAISIPTIPFAVLITPLKYKYLQSVLLLIFSPPFLSLAMYFFDSQLFCETFAVYVWYVDLFSAIFVPVIFCVYWPFNLALQVVCWMKNE